HPSRKNLKAGHFLNEDTENACVSNSLKSAAVGRNPGPRLEEPRGQSESISQVSYILTSCSRPEALSFGTVDETGGSIVLRVSGNNPPTEALFGERGEGEPHTQTVVVTMTDDRAGTETPREKRKENMTSEDAEKT
ncbi:Hypothetical predicted protein, partial [Lynx pardinus]